MHRARGGGVIRGRNIPGDGSEDPHRLGEAVWTEVRSDQRGGVKQHLGARRVRTRAGVGQSPLPPPPGDAAVVPPRNAVVASRLYETILVL